MDKKHLSLGITFVLAALVCYYFAAKFAPPPPAPPAVVQQVVAQQQAAAPNAPILGASPSSQAAFATAASDRKGATITTLENDFIQVRFTDFGGAIRDVALKKYPAVLHGTDPYVLNSVHADPMLAIVDFAGLDRSRSRFQLVQRRRPRKSSIARSSPAGWRSPGGTMLSPDRAGNTDPYQLRAETTFLNLTGQPAAVVPGGAGHRHRGADRPDRPGRTSCATGFSRRQGPELSARGPRSGGERGHARHGRAHEAKSSITDAGPIVWGAVKNQFFSIILTPDQPASDLIQRRIKLFEGLDDSVLNAYGVDCNADFEVRRRCRRTARPRWAPASTRARTNITAWPIPTPSGPTRTR